jgi:hypothetical protein
VKVTSTKVTTDVTDFTQAPDTFRGLVSSDGKSAHEPTKQNEEQKVARTAT